MRRRCVVAVVALVMTIASCGAGDDPQPGADLRTDTSTTPVQSIAPTDVTTTTTTVPPPSSTSSTAPPATSSTVIPTEPVRLSGDVIVAGREGVFTVDPQGDVLLRIPAPATVAVDDTRGGIVYQIASGRDGETSEHDTTIWWWPAGGTAPLDLLVPASGHELTLHDVVDIDGALTVLYGRHEGSTPGDLFDSIRLYDIATQLVTEIDRTAGFEGGFGPASINEDLICVKWYGHLAGSCSMLTHDGAAVDAAPFPEFATCEETDCPAACELSPDGRLAYGAGEYVGDGVWEYRIIVRDALSGEVLEVVDDPPTDGQPVDSLDLDGDLLLVNRGTDLAAARIELGDGSVTELPVAGQARFARSDVVVTAPAGILRRDGLGPFDFGAPVVQVAGAMTGWFGVPDVDDTVTGTDDPLPYGYGTEGYFRIMAWDDFGLTVLFGDAPYFRTDGEAHLVAWNLTGDNAQRLATTEGVSVGSSVADLQAAYGDTLRSPEFYVDVCGEGWMASIETDPGDNWWPRFVGQLSGDPAVTGTVVTALSAGAQSTC